MDPQAPHRLDVLVVDDDGSVATLVRAVLEREGLVVGQAADGASALDVLASTPCRVVLTDFTMPEMDGLALVRAAERQGTSASFLVMSAYLDPSVLAALVAEPAVAGVLGKPFELSALVRDVRALLGQVGPAAEPVTNEPPAGDAPPDDPRPEEEERGAASC